MNNSYDGYAENRLKGNFGEMSSFYLVLPYLSGRKVLDIGCSDGLYLKYFNQESVGIEQIENLANAAKLRNLNVIKGDVGEVLEMQNAESFDAVFYSHVMEHVDNPIKSLREINRVLKPEGILILGLPIERCLIRQLLNMNYFDGTHIYSFTIRNIKKLMLNTNFEILKIQYHLPIKGAFGILVNNLWNKIYFPDKEYFSMGYWIIAKKKLN